MSTAAAVHVRVLGVLEVLANDEPVTIGGERQRTLLVALALAGPAGLSVERAVRQVWDVEPDDVHVGHVRTTVSRLRRQLDAATVETRPGGYRLAQDRVDVDAWRFDDLVARARSEVDDEQRRLLLAAAVALWRGPAAAGTAGRLASSPTVRGLTERRLDAEEELLALQLRTGEHATVADRAAQLLAEHPYRERLRELHVRALADGARVPAALAAIRAYRQLLADDLGLDPSPVIAALERALLGADRLEPEPSDGRFRGYELGRVLRRAPTSTVHVARQPILGREVLLTTVWGPFAHDPSSGRRLEELTQRLERLAEPGIVPLVDGWREAGRLHLVEPSLRALATDLDDVAVADVVARIGRALRALHGIGVVHGSIDRESVRRGPDGRAVLVGTTSAWARRGDGDGAPGTLPEPVVDAVGIAALATSLLAREAGPVDDGLRGALAATVTGGTDLEGLLAAADDVLLAAAQSSGKRRAADVRPAADRAPRNPYRGLAPFGAGDADVFAGREDVVEEITRAIVDERRALVVVTGPSGVGKSSLLAAVVLPAVERRTIRDGRPRIVTMRPGGDAPAALAAALTAVATTAPGAAIAALGEDRGSWDAAVAEVAADSDLVVGVDQLEELWAAPDGGRRFLTLLAELLEHPRTQVVTTVRVDRLGPLLTSPRLGAAARRDLWALGPLDAAGVEAAIRRPAEAEGIHVASGLVAALLADMAENPTALPLLQLTLTTLVDRARGPRLDRAAYDELGGLGGAVVDRGEALVAQAPEQDDVRRLFAQLMTIDGDGHVTRRRERLVDVLAVVPRAVVDEAVDARLLTVGRDAASREPVLDVSHDAIFESWPRMRRWIEEDRDLLRTRTTAIAAAVVWDEEGQPDERLLTGAPLDRARALLDGAVPLPADARRFVDRSVEHADVRRAQECRRRRRERRVVRVAVAAAVTATVLAGLAVVQRTTVARQAVDLQTASLLRAVENVAVDQPILAGQLAVHAVLLDDTAATRAAVARAVTTEPRVVRQLAHVGGVSCPGIVTGAETGVVVGTTQDGRDGMPLGRVASLPGGEIWETGLRSRESCLEPAPTSDGVLVTVGTTVEVIGRDAVGAGVLEDVIDATWARDGSAVHVLTVVDGGTVLRTHDVDDLQVLAEYPLDLPFAAAVEVSDQVAVVAGPSAPPVVVDLVSGRRRTLEGAEGAVLVAVPAGEVVLGASRDRLLRWDDDGVRAVPLTGTDPTSLVVTPDGSVAAVATSIGIEFVDLEELGLLGEALRLPGAVVAPVSAESVGIVAPDGRVLEVDVRRRDPLRRRRGPSGELGVVRGGEAAVIDGANWRLVRDGTPTLTLGRRQNGVQLLDAGGAVVVEPGLEVRVVGPDGTVLGATDVSQVWVDGDVVPATTRFARDWPTAVDGLVTVPHRTDAGSVQAWQVLVVDLEEGAVVTEFAVRELVATTPLADRRVVVADTAGVVRIVDLTGAEVHAAQVVGVPTALQADGGDVLVGLADGGVTRWTPGQGLARVGQGGLRDAVLWLAVVDDGRILAAHESGRLVLLVPGEPDATVTLVGRGAVGGPVSVTGATASLVHDGEVVDVSLTLSDWVAAACRRSAVPINAEAWLAATGVAPPTMHPCEPWGG